MSDSHVETACASLLVACRPSMYDANAFRILGLPVDASTKDVTRRVSDIKQAHEDDDAASEHTSAFALDPPPDIETVNDAARKLQDAERRIIDEFFWFWPTEWGQGRNDPAFQALLDGDKQKAFDIWAAMERDKDANLRIVARHNLAVIYHFYALTYEMKVLERNRRDATLDRMAAYWKASFERWEALAHFPQLAIVKIKFAGKFGFFREKSGLHFDRFWFVGHG